MKLYYFIYTQRARADVCAPISLNDARKRFWQTSTSERLLITYETKLYYIQDLQLVTLIFTFVQNKFV